MRYFILHIALFAICLNTIAQDHSITNQPMDVVDCNGSDAFFYVEASGDSLTYHWFRKKNNEELFESLTGVKSYDGVDSPLLKIEKLINSDNEDQFYCKISDNTGSELNSDTVKVYVNKLSSTIKPTTATEYCEKDIVELNLSGISGEVLNISWFLLNDDSDYILLSESEKYNGATTDLLLINGIEKNENSYKAEVEFPIVNLNSIREPVEGSCVLTAKRNNYVINDSPENNYELLNNEACQGAEFLAQINSEESNFNWYSDSLKTTVLESNSSSWSGLVDSNSPFVYYSHVSDKGCESEVKSSEITLFELPTFAIGEINTICISETSLVIPFENLSDNVSHFSIKSVSPQIIGLELVANQLINNREISLPIEKNSGTYTLEIAAFSELTGCNSESVFVEVAIGENLEVLSQIEDRNICLGGGIEISPEISIHEGCTFSWKLNGEEISTENTLIISDFKDEDIGDYGLEVTNGCQTVVFDDFRLGVKGENEIVFQSESIEICEGDSTGFTIELENYDGTSFEWFKNGNLLLGETGSAISFSSVSESAVYRVEAISECGSKLVSDDMHLVKLEKPQSIVLEPEYVFCVSETIRDIEINYDLGNRLVWFNEQGDLINEPDFASLEVGGYSYFILQEGETNCQSAESQVNVAIKEEPVFSVPPADVIKCKGNTADFIVEINEVESLVWERKLPEDEVFFEMENENSNELKIRSIGNSENPHLTRYRLKAVVGECIEYSDEAVLYVNSKDLTLASQNACFGNSVLFETPATTGTILEYQWQVKEPNESSFMNIEEGIEASYLISEANEALNGAKYRVKLSFATSNAGQTCTITTDDGTLNVKKFDFGLTKEDISCYGLNNGSVSVDNVVGFSPFEFIVNDTLVSSALSFESLAKGKYKIVGTDVIGCTYRDSVEVEEPEDFTFTVVSVKPTCEGSKDGQVKIEGVAYALWEDGSTLLERNDLESGSYTIEVYNSTECKKDTTLVLTAPIYFEEQIEISSLDSLTCLTSPIRLKAANCDYTVVWNTGEQGEEIEILPTANTTYKAKCVNGVCESAWSNELEILVAEELIAGAIEEFSIVACSGYNPPKVNSIVDASGGTAPLTYSWQSKENEGAEWQEIENTDDEAYNPGALEESAFFRRKVSDFCGFERFTNEVLFEINADPTAELMANTTELEVDEQLMLSSLVLGGVEPCLKQWQINFKSGAKSSSYWQNLAEGVESLQIDTLTHQVNKEASVFFRLIIDCELSSCNKAYSESIKVDLKPIIVEQDLEITSQPINQTDCDGNGVNFSVDAVGEGELSYTWQVKSGEDFIDLINDDKYIKQADQPTVKLYYINSEVDGNVYRCKVADNKAIVYSNEVRLGVNYLEGNFPDLDYCQTDALKEVDLLEFFTVSGEVSRINWQEKIDNVWTDIAEGEKLRIINSGKFRCAIEFITTDGFCKEYTDQSTIEIHEKLEVVDFDFLEFCLGETASLPSKDISKNTLKWYKNNVALENLELVTKVSGEETYEVQKIGADGCDSDVKEVKVRVLELSEPPINTTPEAIDFGEELVFSAEGENLKWFRTYSIKAYSESPPIFTEVGKYYYYVSQSKVGFCESPRLKVESSILAPLQISKQPESQFDCDGNSVNFETKVNLKEGVTYQWYRKSTDSEVFVKLDGEVESKLKVSDVGDGKNQSGSLYKCLVSNGKVNLESNEAQLIVNRIEGELSPKSICDLTSFNFDETEVSFVGELENWYWQKQNGSKYYTDENLKGSLVVNKNEFEGDYRIQAIFKINGNATCTRYTKEFSLEVNEAPKAPGNKLIERCKGDTLKLPQEVYSLSKEKVETVSTGSYFWANKSEKGCLSAMDSLSVEIIEKPNLPDLDSEYEICRADSLIFTSQELVWFLEENTEEYNERFPINELFGSTTLYAANKVGPNCQSPKVAVKFKLKSCETDLISCYANSISNIKGTGWHELTGPSGEVIAKINTNGQNLGRVYYEYTKEQEAYIGSAGIEYLPKVLYLSSDYPLESSVQIDTEENYKTALRYRHLNEDCSYYNNDNFQGESWVLDRSESGVLTNSLGEFLFSKNEFSELKYIVHEKLGNTIKLNWEFNTLFKPKTLFIYKSKDEENWDRLTAISPAETSFVDTYPFSGKSYYKLVLQDEEGNLESFKTDSVDVQNVECKVFPNPVLNNKTFNLYSGDSAIGKVQVFDLESKPVPLNYYYANDGYYVVNFKNKPAIGNYIVVSSNSNGDICTKQIFIK